MVDTLWPATDWAARAQDSSVAGLTVCFAAGCEAAWRRRDFGHGGVVALAAILIGFVVAVIAGVTAVLVISAFRDLDRHRALVGAAEVPLPVMLLVGGPVGAAGAAVGAGLRRLGRARR